MTAWFSYVGDLDDPAFNWDQPSKLPRRVALDGAEPSYNLGISIFFLIRAITEGRIDGKQLDWSAWAARLTGAEIQALITDRRLECLQPKEHYALVVAEEA